MPDPLGKLRGLANRLDRKRARPSRIEPKRLILASRTATLTRQLCFDCRQSPTIDGFVARWLADNPPPPARCTIDQNGYVCSERKYHHRICDNCVETSRRLHLASMTDASSVWTCPMCGGRIVEITA